MGENLQVEFKQQMPKLTRLAKTFSAFSNSSGGKVFFGVQDDGRFLPLDNPEGTLDLAQQVADFYCKPSIPIQSEFIEVGPGKRILVVEIEESGDKPIHAADAHNPKDTWPYFRSNKENLPMDKKTLRTMRRVQSENLEEAYPSMNRHEQKIIESLWKTPRQTIYQLSRSSNIGTQRTKKMMVGFERNGWVHAFFNEKRREYSLVVPWKR